MGCVTVFMILMVLSAISWAWQISPVLGILAILALIGLLYLMAKSASNSDSSSTIESVSVRPTGTEWNRIQDAVLKRDRNMCQRCGGYGRMHVDHVVPLARGGHPTDLRNLQSLCWSCNQRKGTTTASYTASAPGVYANGRLH